MSDFTNMLELPMREDHRHCAVLNGISDCVIVTDTQGLITHFNLAAETITGCHRDEVLGTPIADILQTFDPSGNGDSFDLAAGVVGTRTAIGPIEMTVQIGNQAEPIPALVHASPSEDSEGASSGVVLQVRDVSKQKSMEEDLHFMRFTFDCAADAIFWADLDKRFIYVNDAACEHLGYTREELLEMSIPDISVCHNPEQFADRREQLKQTHHVRYESLHRHKSGKLIPIEISLNLTQHHNQTFTCGIVRDISHRKFTQEVMRQSEARNLLLKEIAIAANEAATPDEALLVAIHQVCVYKKWPVGHVYVLDSSEENGLAPSDLWHLDHPERFKAFQEVTRQTRFEEGIGLPGRVLRDQKPHWITNLATDGNFPRYQLARDIGVHSGFAFPVIVDQKVVAVLEFFSQQEEEIDVVWLEIIERIGIQLGIVIQRQQTALDLKATHNQLLESARRAGMAEIATNVLHDVGNVLNSINVSSTLISEKLTSLGISRFAQAAQLIEEHHENFGAYVSHDDRGRHLPQFLVSLSKHMNSMEATILGEVHSLAKCVDHVRDIVACQQLHAGSTEFVVETSVADLVEDALYMNRDSLTRHEIAINYAPLEMETLHVDKRKCLQILVNLISNAKDAIVATGRKDGKITLRVDQEDDKLLIFVMDNGIGISKENLTQIFVYGFTTRADGHGFGLHGSALAATEMDGKLSCHSDGHGKGATFTLELPLRIASS